MKSVKCGVAHGLQRLGQVVTCVGFLISLTNVSFAEDRTLSMFNIHTKDTITVTFKRDGKYVPEALQALNHFMRDWRRNQEIRMDPALIDLIWELHAQLGSKEPVHLICGYRSAATNEMLRHTVGGQAQHSRHITGQAADLMFPDVPLKQLRYSALIQERGGVGFYPASGLPFVHVDTGNVRMWPRMPRLELAMLFPKGHSLYVPADGRPLTPADSRIALARAEANGLERPWVLTHKHAGPMLASLVAEDAPLLQRVSLAAAAPAPAGQAPKPAIALVRPEGLTGVPAEAPEPQLAEEGDEQDDVISFEPLPATFLLADKPLSYLDIPEGQAREPVLKKIGLLMAPASVLASEEFDRRLQLEDLYEANSFKGRAFALMERMKARMSASLEASPKQATR